MRSMNQLAKLMMVLCASMAFAYSAFALSPPWVILQAQLKATIGADRCADVGDLREGPSESYEIDITAKCDIDKAHALATFLTRTHDFGGVTVEVTVRDRNGDIVEADILPENPEDVAEIVERALSTNPFFAEIDEGNGVFAFFATFKKLVVQYPADNIGDTFKNNNQVAADAFREVMNFEKIEKPHIGTGTLENSNRPKRDQRD